MNKDKTQFLLISPPRVGSQVLLSSLYDTNSTIFNEIFTHKKYTDIYPQKNMRFQHPKNYINFFFKSCVTPVCGAKILAPSFPKASFKKVFSRCNYKVIYMFRKNIMENVCSLFIAKQTKQWMSTHKKPVKNFKKFIINEDEFERKLEKIYLVTKRCVEAFLNYQINLKVVTYEDLYKNDSFDLKVINDIRNFVDLPSVDVFSTKFIKQNNISTYNKIINIDKLQKKFNKYGKLGDGTTPKIWNKNLRVYIGK